jgi:hypothetical protein
MELAVSLSLFASRVQEIRVPLQVLFISSCGNQIVDKHDHSNGVQIMKKKGVFC